VPPDTAITSQPPDPAAINSGSFTFTATKTGSTFQCSMDGAPFSACSTPYSFSGLANGPHTFSVRAVDQLGTVDPTPATASWTINVTAPNVKLATPGQPDTFFATITAALAAMPAAPPSLIVTRQLDFLETVDMNRCGTTVTIGQAYEPGFVTPVGPTVISGGLIVSCGKLILDNVEIR
jgi:hypothetical protein